MGTEAKTRVSSAAVSGRQEHPLISEAKARQLFELVLEFRSAPERGDADALWMVGREAVLAGVMADLRSGDAVVAEGGARMSETRQPQPPVLAPSPAAITLTDRIVESLSCATLDRLRGNGRVTVIFSPANPDAVPAEARALACGAKLPVLFVEDGRAADGKGGEEMPAIPVDADDVVALYRVAHESIARARSGSGPTQMLCVHRHPVKNVPRPETAGEDALERLEQWLTARGYSATMWREQFAARREAVNPADIACPAGAGAGRAERPRFAPDPQPFVQPDIQTN